MMRIFPSGSIILDDTGLSEEQLQEVKLRDEQTCLYNSRNEILRGLAYEAESLGYDDPRKCPETKTRFKEVTDSYNEKIKAIDKQLINSNKQLMAFIENGC